MRMPEKDYWMLNGEKMKEYWKKIYKTRYFWSHLAKKDLEIRFRRSKLGILWTVVQPFCMTVILSLVFGVVFNQPLGEYSMYILTGIVVWDLLQASVVGGGNALFGSEQYIRQFNHPISIYTLRFAVLNMGIFLLEMVALIVWVFFARPINLVFAIFTIPLTTILYFPLAWSLATISGYMGAKYRDYPQIMILVMQMIYFLSPVFFRQEMFDASPALKTLFIVNPITHILNLLRSPFVYTEMPQIEDYIFVIVVDLFFCLWAAFINKKNEKKIIFYL